ncbi:MAG: hypothetical protein EAZ08_12910 [Cytophagales bacterium]|nr:MAG: hypothetical protein EAZ08_12910 [Cytophagales bacterium]
MAHLTGIGIENFRVFKDYTEFDFAPITILTGANSSGKSSLFKALLLLADNAKRNALTELNFTGEGHFLGTFETAKSKGSDKEEIKFVLEYKRKITKGLPLRFEPLFGLLSEGAIFEYIYNKEGLISLT